MLKVVTLIKQNCYEKRIFHKNTFFCFLIAFSTGAQAQFQSDSLFWIDGSVGLVLHDPTLISDIIGANYQHDKWIYRGRYGNYTDYALMGENQFNLHEFSAMAGKRKLNRLSHLYGNVGLGFLTGKITHQMITNSGGTTTTIPIVQNISTVCIPFECEYMFIPAKFTGIGMGINGNLNLKRPLIGLQLKFSLGKVR